MYINLELDEQSGKDLKALLEAAKIDSYKDLFNNALTLFSWAIEQVKAGRIVASLDEENKIYKEVSVPVFEKVRTRNSS